MHNKKKVQYKKDIRKIKFLMMCSFLDGKKSKVILPLKCQKCYWIIFFERLKNVHKNQTGIFIYGEAALLKIILQTQYQYFDTKIY